ncbi:NADH-cytochrome b-5 reductase [Diplocarpon rosae]|nr:NADH-cytochrome b-5 reductase [Diplocarpon rosae]
MLSSIVEEEEEEEKRMGSRESARPGLQVRFLYSVRSPEGAEGEEVLFLSRLRSLFRRLGERGSLRLFVTGKGEVMDAGDLRVARRRMTDRDVEDALGDVTERSGTVCYVCGVPGMTDELVAMASKAEGMDRTRVLSEKWW